jgi:hypothetical protein
MLSKSVLAAVAALAFAQPVFAQDAMKADPMKPDAMAMEMKCDDASMMKLQGDIDATGDAMKKDAAMKEMAMASDAMKANDPAKCVTHMDAAMKAAGGM